MPNWFDIITGLFKPIADVIDHIVPSGEGKLQLQQKLLEAQTGAAAQAMEYEKQLLDAQTKVVLAEAQGSSWLQRNWRPLMMVWFAGLIGARWLGYTPPGLSEALELKLFDIVQLGIGGYVIGRSAEKTVPAIVEAIKGNKNG